MVVILRQNKVLQIKYDAKTLNSVFADPLGEKKCGALDLEGARHGWRESK